MSKYNKMNQLSIWNRFINSSIKYIQQYMKNINHFFSFISKLDIGTHFNANCWLNVECCGLFCGFLTISLILFGCSVTTFLVIIPWLGFSYYGMFHIFLFNFGAFLALYSHIKAMFTNPGAVPLDAKPLDDDQMEINYQTIEIKSSEIVEDSSIPTIPMIKPPFHKYCKRCKVFKPDRSHHCSICNRCIVKMDHHCVWVNNCVGLHNHKYFLLFVFWTCFISIYAIILLSSKVTYCFFNANSIGCQIPSNGDDLQSFILVLFLFLESVLFSMFTLCILSDQSSILTTFEAKIDRLKSLTNMNGSISQKKKKVSESTLNSSSTSSCDLNILCLRQHPITTTTNKIDNMEDNSNLLIDNNIEEGTAIMNIAEECDEFENGVNELCGGSLNTKFHYTWLIPTTVSFPWRILQRIQGFKSEEKSFSSFDFHVYSTSDSAGLVDIESGNISTIQSSFCSNLNRNENNVRKRNP